MQSINIFLTLLPSLLALTLVVAPASAEKGGKGADKHAEKQRQKAQHEHQKREQKLDHEYQKREHKAEHEYQKREQKAEHEYMKREQKAAKFRDDQRSRVVSYYRERYADGRDCPPGLRKKNNGCQPPGHAKRYSVGRALSGDVSLYPLPQDLIVGLSPPPPGFAYGFIDGDVVLYEVPTRVVVDVVVVPF
ncbi:MAG TPA: hypothetical protein VEC57_16330 [Candidatus Limnocylindrales bacterium]|nr:hypothetical protein [Candidatus Limnocylindrales bacterium]